MSKKNNNNLTIDAGTLYDVNKDLVRQVEKPIKGQALEKKVEEVIAPFIQELIQNGESYFMLLCHDKRDYTVFNMMQNRGTAAARKCAQELKECLENRGDIYGIDITQSNDAIEIWINYYGSGIVCFYFFPYSNAVIEVRS